MTCHILAHAQTIRKLCVHTCGSESCEGKTRGKQTTSVTARHGHLWPVDPGSHWPSAVDWRRSSWYGTVYDDQEKNKYLPRLVIGVWSLKYRRRLMKHVPFMYPWPHKEEDHNVDVIYALWRCWRMVCIFNKCLLNTFLRCARQHLTRRMGREG